MILITAATGNIGSELVQQLTPTAEPLRVVSRDERKVAHLDPRIERVIGDLNDPATVARALKGVDRLFLNPAITTWDAGKQPGDVALIDGAKAAGVRHIVMVSTMAPESNPIGKHHRAKERQIEATGLDWTFLRPGGFSSNVLQWAGTIKAQGKVFSPTGEGKLNPISPADIAAVAALALTQPGHAGKAYTLIGEESLSAREQTEILSRILGKPIAYVDTPIATAADQLRQRGAPPPLVEALSEMWTRIRSGSGVYPAAGVSALLGRPLQTFEQWARAHRAAFL